MIDGFHPTTTGRSDYSARPLVWLRAIKSGRTLILIQYAEAHGPARVDVWVEEGRSKFAPSRERLGGRSWEDESRWSLVHDVTGWQRVVGLGGVLLRGGRGEE